MPETVLIVDEDPTQREIIRHVVEHKLHCPSVALGDPREAIDHIVKNKQPMPQLLLLDLSAPGELGLELIKEVMLVFPHLPILVLTLYGDTEKAAAAMQAGATDFLSKPVTVERLGVSLRNILRLSALKREMERMQRAALGALEFSDLVGVSSAFRYAAAQSKEIAPSDISVVIEGERGVGKTSLAQAIHGGSRRRSKAFVTFDCRGLLEYPAPRFPLKESYEGTLFLKEPALLSAGLQERLIKELNGSSGRLISSSSCPLEPLVAQGRFRRDLFARLQQVKVMLPPLRDRREDIAPLAEHFLKQHGLAESVQASRLTPAATSLLVSYGWSGNLSQLQRIIQRAMIFCRREMLDIEDFQPLFSPTSLQRNAPKTEAKTARRHLEENEITGPLPVLSILQNNGQMKRIEQIEAELIQFAIGYYGGHMSEVARRLGIGRSTLYRKMQENQITSAA